MLTWKLFRKNLYFGLLDHKLYVFSYIQNRHSQLFTIFFQKRDPEPSHSIKCKKLDRTICYQIRNLTVSALNFKKQESSRNCFHKEERHEIIKY